MQHASDADADADANRLPRRVFYVPSMGKGALWFDAIKQSNTKKVIEMIAQGQNLEVKDDAILGQTAL